MDRNLYEETPATGVRQPVSRRRLLGMVGLAGGTAAALGASGLTWRAVDQGVFATGTGPAYAAWDQPNRPGDAATLCPTGPTTGPELPGRSRHRVS
jgi:hypothetical protein